MQVGRLWVENYRSLRGLSLELGRITVVTGPNGSGKSNLYRALNLLVAAARGDLAQQLLTEGGMPSAMWAGDHRRGPVRVTIGVSIDDYSYELAFGLSPDAVGADDGPRPFALDPDVKDERCWFGDAPGRHNMLLQRTGAAATAVDVDGTEVRYPHRIASSETVLGDLAEPARFPELFGIRRQLLGWRFYHHFDTSAAAPMRSPRPGVRTPVLSASGDDLAAALLTIVDTGDRSAIEAAIQPGFPGSRLAVHYHGDGTLTLELETAGVRRPLAASELSDGTLRFLALVAALLSPRPPSLMILNEPETSLHPELIPSLADLIIEASARSQIWVTTHSERLASLLAQPLEAQAYQLRMASGATTSVPF